MSSRQICVGTGQLMSIFHMTYKTNHQVRFYKINISRWLIYSANRNIMINCVNFPNNHLIPVLIQSSSKSMLTKYYGSHLLLLLFFFLI